mmetsp:Transcript_44187/g.94752  ORF Transcript_44187/g.94752 Transcript_44187/m.94752 type:complete len:379 (+) Transcript_44187:119-1255(+)
MPAETTSAGSPHEAAVVARARQRLAARATAMRSERKHPERGEVEEEEEEDQEASLLLPEPQLVLARFPDGTEGQRFARLDPSLRAVGVRELKRSAADGKVEVGKETLFPLESVASLKYKNRTVLLMGQGDALLLWLQLDTPQEAQAWVKGIEALMDQIAASQGASSEAPEDPAAWRSARAREVKRLKALCVAHENRIETLADLNQRKQGQVLRMQAKLEEALSILQAGQVTYSKQQKVLDEQQAVIEELKRQKDRGADAPDEEKPVAVTSSEEEDDEDEEEEEDEDENITALLDLARRADILQQQVREAGASRSNGGRSDDSGLGRAGATASQVLHSAPALLAHLQALKAEKDRLQSNLESEQAALEEELRSLQTQMS